MSTAMSPNRFGNKVAAVTGASRGIGRAIAPRLAREGATVALAARDGAAVDAVVREIEAAGGRALGLALDLREPEAPARLVAAAADRFGGSTSWSTTPVPPGAVTSSRSPTRTSRTGSRSSSTPPCAPPGRRGHCWRPGGARS